MTEYIVSAEENAIYLSDASLLRHVGSPASIHYVPVARGRFNEMQKLASELNAKEKP